MTVLFFEKKSRHRTFLWKEKWAKETSVIGMSKFYIFIKGAVILLLFYLSRSFLREEKKAKEASVIGFEQLFYYLHIRALLRRGGVSPPVTPSLSIFGQNKLRLFYCIPFAYRFQGATLLLIFSSLFSQKIPHKRDFLLFEVKTVFFEYLHCKALSLPSFSFNSVRIFS